MHCSRMLRASLTEPSALEAIVTRASWVTSMPLLAHILSIPAASSLSVTLLKLSCMHLDLMVDLTFCGSVVARMKMACSGGSSRVLRNAFSAAWLSMCTSSMMYTLYLPTVGGYFTISMMALRSSTPLLDAASSSMQSTNLPSRIASQLAQCPQGMVLPSPRSAPGVPGSPSMQLTALARILAVLVLPVPWVPENR